MVKSPGRQFSQSPVNQQKVQIESGHPIDNSGRVRSPSRQFNQIESGHPVDCSTRQSQVTQQTVQLDRVGSPSRLFSYSQITQKTVQPESGHLVDSSYTVKLQLCHPVDSPSRVKSPSRKSQVNQLAFLLESNHLEDSQVIQQTVQPESIYPVTVQLK